MHCMDACSLGVWDAAQDTDEWQCAMFLQF